MTEEFIAKQKQNLEKELTEIFTSLEEKNKSLQEQREYMQVHAGTDSDNAVLRRMARMEEALGYRESEKVPQIIMALQKIEKGTYGKCHHCNKEIAEARLEAIPYAQACIDCQKKLNDDWRKENGEYIHYYWKYVDARDFGLLEKYYHRNANTDFINHK